ncbi:MAG: hypothetical protein K8T25_17725 [Planctomycetia bacterium]|nr:hypothetical protein [Planctomycetia bacterium]
MKGPATAGWPKEGNPGQAFDVWLRNALPFNKPFRNHAYYTLNFIPSIATMVFGLMAGELLQSPLRPWRKFGWLVGVGLLGMGAGLALDLGGVCPLIKKIWTPSWTLFSGGACLVLLGAFYALVDLWGWRRWTLPAVVLGANSIAVYVVLELYCGWMVKTINQQVVHGIWPSISVPWAATITSLLAVGAFWLVFYVLYRSRVFVRI